MLGLTESEAIFHAVSERETAASANNRQRKGQEECGKELGTELHEKEFGSASGYRRCIVLLSQGKVLRVKFWKWGKIFGRPAQRVVGKPATGAVFSGNLVQGAKGRFFFPGTIMGTVLAIGLYGFSKELFFSGFPTKQNYHAFLSKNLTAKFRIKLKSV